MRIIAFTGTGGAGATSIAAATAVRCAALGRRTLLLAIDGTRALDEVVEARAGSSPTPICERLWAQHAAGESIERRWSAVAGWLSALFAGDGPDAPRIEDLPGAAGVLGLIALTEHAASAAFDVITVDLGPAPRVVRLLNLAASVHAWSSRTPIPPVLSRRTQILARLAGLPTPDEAVLAGVREIITGLAGAGEILTGAGTTSVRLVLTPSRVSLDTGARALAALGLRGCAIDLVLCNQMIPAAVRDPFFAPRQAAETRTLEQAGARCAPVPLRPVDMLRCAPVGAGALARLAEAVYAGDDPASTFAPAQSVRVTDNAGTLTLEVPLPAAGSDGITVTQEGDRVIIGVPGARRGIALPPALAGRACRAAAFDGGTLRLRF